MSRDTLFDIDENPKLGSTMFYHPNHDISPDGRSVVFLRSRDGKKPQLVFIHDWKYELRARVNQPNR